MTTGLSGADLVRLIGSFALVIALMGGLLWLLRRMQTKISGHSRGRRLQLIESLSLNTRHKLALVQVDGQQVLIGMSPAQLTALAHWSQDGSITPTAGSSARFDLNELTGAHHAP